MSQPNPQKIRMYYVGACGLISRLSSRREISEEDRLMMRRAVQDCADLLPDSFKTVEVQNGGLALEPNMEFLKNAFEETDYDR